MRTLLAVVACIYAGDAACAEPAAAPAEELRDEKDDGATPPATSTPQTPIPVENDPKLPLAGKPIKIDLPEKNQGSSLLWQSRWRKFSVAEGVITGASLATALGSLFVPVRPTAWNQPGFLFDEPARNAVRVRSEGWRLNVRDTSDVLLSLSTMYPFLVDSLMVAWWHRGSATVATQMALMNAEAMAIGAGVQGVVSALFSRERPFGRDCDEESRVGSTRDCQSYNRYRSFFSGHSSQAFVGAMLTCAHHANIPLYGSVAADRTACVTHIAVAATVATMRVLADVHYASDVITGAIVGSGVGLAVPYLLHYRGRPSAGTASAVWTTMRVTPLPTGFAITGIFG